MKEKDKSPKKRGAKSWYGEPTSLLQRKVPASKKAEIAKQFDAILSKYLVKR